MNFPAGMRTVMAPPAQCVDGRRLNLLQLLVDRLVAVQTPVPPPVGVDGLIPIRLWPVAAK
jgi:hypothetical protein